MLAHEGEGTMKPTLRIVLADSHVAAVAIAMLVFFSIAWFCQLVWLPFSRVPNFLSDAYPYFLDVQWVQYAYSRDLRSTFGLQPFYVFLGSAIIEFTAAWVLSLWVYGTWPFEALIACHARLRRKDA